MFKAVEDFNPLRTIDVEWGCCMAVGFNLQVIYPSILQAAGLKKRQTQNFRQAYFMPLIGT
ncbi:hypothetical protein [Saprospira grandis]|uniref:hypothetical protein n=1 Tax=Saprospira grandis TaxID=1008 RepID=UPI00030FE71D